MKFRSKTLILTTFQILLIILIPTCAVMVLEQSVYLRVLIVSNSILILILILRFGLNQFIRFIYSKKKMSVLFLLIIVFGVLVGGINTLNGINQFKSYAEYSIITILAFFFLILEDF